MSTQKKNISTHIMSIQSQFVSSGLQTGHSIQIKLKLLCFKLLKTLMKKNLPISSNFRLMNSCFIFSILHNMYSGFIYTPIHIHIHIIYEIHIQKSNEKKKSQESFVETIFLTTRTWYEK